MTTVAIIGAGDLGGACARALAASHRVSRVLLVDDAASTAVGKALDIMQSGAVDGFHCQFAGTDDVSAASGAAACVIADRFPTPARSAAPAGALASEWQGDEALAMLKRLLTYAPEAPLVFAGATQAELMLHAVGELRVVRQRAIGSAPEAFASALRAIVALEARSSPNEVMLAVLGVPGGFVVPWSEASIGGYALDRVLSQVEIARVEARAARLWPPGPFTLGLAASRIVEGMLGSSRRSFSALTLLGGEFGVRNRIGALPVRLAPAGIVQVRVPSLNTRERVQVETALGAP